MKITVIRLLIILFFIGCNQTMKFDLVKWKTKEDGIYIYRDKMIDDVMKNHQLVGLAYNQTLELLGTPEYEDSTTISYELFVDYGRDIDPVYTKYLTLSLTKDSVISSFAINEWRK